MDGEHPDLDRLLPDVTVKQVLEAGIRYFDEWLEEIESDLTRDELLDQHKLNMDTAAHLMGLRPDYLIGGDFVKSGNLEDVEMCFYDDESEEYIAVDPFSEAYWDPCNNWHHTHLVIEKIQEDGKFYDFLAEFSDLREFLEMTPQEITEKAWSLYVD